MARTKSAAKAGAARVVAMQLVPTASSFDFLEGTFRAAQRARQVFLTFALVLTAGVGALVLLGVAVAVSTSSEQTTLSSLQDEQAVTNQDIVKKGGSTIGQAAARVKDRKAAVKDAVGAEVDVPTLLNGVQAATPAGVTVTTITIGSATATAPTAGATPAAGATPPAPPSRVLTVNATVTSLPQVPAFQTALQGLPQLMNVTTKWSGSVPNLSVTVTATISDTALSARAQQAVREAATLPATTTGSR